MEVFASFKPRTEVGKLLVLKLETSQDILGYAASVFDSLFVTINSGVFSNEQQNDLREIFSMVCYLRCSSVYGSFTQLCYFADLGLIIGGPNCVMSAELQAIASVENPNPLLLSNLNISFMIETNFTNCQSVTQVLTSIGIEEFVSCFLIPGIPVVLRRFVCNWVAVTKWKSLRFWTCRFGHRLVPVEIGTFSDNKFDIKLMTLDDFLSDHILNENQKNSMHQVYLAQHNIFDQIPSLEDDVLPIPDICFAGQILRRFFFFGNFRNFSPFHIDPFNNLFCQIVGSKLVILISPEDWIYEDLKNMNFPEIEKFPLYEKIRKFQIILNPGDSLFIPKGWWHFVKNLSTVSISVANFFE